MNKRNTIVAISTAALCVLVLGCSHKNRAAERSSAPVADSTTWKDSSLAYSGSRPDAVVTTPPNGYPSSMSTGQDLGASMAYSTDRSPESGE